jgi:hypothetical protein
VVVVVDVGLLEVLPFEVGVGVVAVLDPGVVVLVRMAGELVLPGVAMAQVVGHVQVVVVMHGGLVPMLLHGVCLLVGG